MINLDRRKFLKGMFAGAALLAVPVELLPHVPDIKEGTKFYTMSVNDMDMMHFSDEIIRPAMEKLAKAVDDYVAEEIRNGRMK